MLRLECVSAYYDRVQALREVSFEVQSGEILAVIGPNGAGKSTLLRTISGLIRPRTGSIKLDDRVISSMAPHDIVRCGINHVPEGRRLFWDLTVDENLRLGAYVPLRQRHDGWVAQRRQLVFDVFPVIQERLRQPAGTLSGGEQQMLAIGRGLMAAPRVLLLDEPSIGLAPRVVETIFASLRRLNAEGMTILLVEQNATVALDVAHRGLLMELGRVVAGGPSEELRRSQRVQEVYLGRE